MSDTSSDCGAYTYRMRVTHGPRDLERRPGQQFRHRSSTYEQAATVQKHHVNFDTHKLLGVQPVAEDTVS